MSEARAPVESTSTRTYLQPGGLYKTWIEVKRVGDKAGTVYESDVRPSIGEALAQALERSKMLEP